MNAVAIERMEKFAREVLKLTPEMQVEFYEEIQHNGLVTAEEAEGLKKYVALFHMFTDTRYYNAVRDCVKEMYMDTLNKSKRP